MKHKYTPAQVREHLAALLAYYADRSHPNLTPDQALKRYPALCWGERTARIAALETIEKKLVICKDGYLRIR